MSEQLKLRDSGTCEFDVVSLGEVMLRLDPGQHRIRDARRFEPWVGGGEFNVANGLSSCFGLKTSVVTALARNEIGQLMLNLIRAGGIDTSLIRWTDDEGPGGARNGLNFTERGFGLRGALGVSDRAGSAASKLAAGDIDWHDLFGRRGVRWLHTGGVFTALSESTAELAYEAVKIAKQYGTVVSYDVNFRPSLWKAMGDIDRHTRDVGRIFEHVDVLFSNEPEYRLSIGEKVIDDGASQSTRFERMVEDLSRRYSQISVVAATLRTVHSASDNSWAGIAWSSTEGFVTSTYREHVEVLDRVGAGDAFAAGCAFGLLSSRSLRSSLELGAAHGILTMTTPGDTSSASAGEVEALAAGARALTMR